jgi:hypothetical protein
MSGVPGSDLQLTLYPRMPLDQRALRSAISGFVPFDRLPCIVLRIAFDDALSGFMEVAVAICRDDEIMLDHRPMDSRRFWKDVNGSDSTFKVYETEVIAAGTGSRKLARSKCGKSAEMS